MPTIKQCVFVFAAATLFSCAGKNKMRYETFHGAAGWGYVIMVDGRIIICQEAAPGLAGSKGFETAPQAEAMAKLVMKKLAKGGGPPSVTSKEAEQVMRMNAFEKSP